MGRIPSKCAKLLEHHIILGQLRPHMDRDPKEIVRQLALQVGKHEARRRLVDEGISTSTADKLVGERYPSEIGQLLLQAILKARMAIKRPAS